MVSLNIRPNKKNMCGSGYMVQVGRIQFFLNLFFLNIQTCLKMY